MAVADNMPRSAEMSSIAFNPANGTVLATDEAGDVLRVISLNSQSAVAAISLPSGSQAHSVAINSVGTMAAVGLSAKGAIAIVDLAGNQVTATVTTGFDASQVVAGTNLLATNSASGTVSIIDAAAAQITKTIAVGYGPAAIATSGNIAVVGNMQGGSISLINLTDYSVKNISLPAGSRPYELAISSSMNKAVITDPMLGRVFLLDMATQNVTQIQLGAAVGMGSGAVATNGNLAFIAGQMNASIAVLDLRAGGVIKTFTVDPGPRSMAVDSGGNRLLVLCEGTGTIDVLDDGSYSLISRIDGTSGTAPGRWNLSTVALISPTSGVRGSTFALAINGTDLQHVTNVEFLMNGDAMGSGMMGGDSGYGADPNTKVTNVQPNSAGTQVTVSVQILAAAVGGPRQVRIDDSDHGPMMGALNATTFTVQ